MKNREKRMIKHIKVWLAAALLAVAIAGSANAAFVQSFSYDTSSVAGNQGYIEFEFNPLASYEHGSAAVYYFSDGSGTVGQVIDREGTNLGTLTGDPADPNNLNFSAVPPLSRYVQSIVFGNSISFTVSICCSDSLFSLALQDEFRASLLTTNSNGHLLEITSGGDCNTCTVNSTPTPVPTAAWLLGSGLLGLVGLRRRQA